MSFRFRLGPFTFGRSGTRLSVWGRGGGFSTPISGNGRSFGKIAVGPFRWFFRGSPVNRHAVTTDKNARHAPQNMLLSPEATAIEALQVDRQFLDALRQRGLPWRGVQEQIKENLPDTIADRDRIAYALVPKAMDAVFGKQGSGWKTERRRSKSNNGKTTWIVVISSRI